MAGLALFPRAGKLSQVCLPPRLSPRYRAETAPVGHALAVACPCHTRLPLQLCQAQMQESIKKVILNKKKATWLCWVQGCHRGLLPFAFVCGFLWYLHFQLTGSLGKLTVSPFSRRAAERKCFSLSSAWCFPFQLGQTAINTAHPVLHSNCCESLRP